MPESESDFETVTVRVAHRDGDDVHSDGTGEDLVRTYETYYTLTSVEIRRPTHGFRRLTTMVRCGKCGKEMRCDAYSPLRARWRRLRQVVIGVALLALAVGAWFVLIWRGTSPVNGLMGVFLFGLAVVGVVLLGLSFAFFRPDDDQDLSIRLHGDRLHTLRDTGYQVVVRATPPVPY